MHCEKYNKSGLGNLLAHYERKDNKFRKYKNENIDKEKTYLNYNLAPKRENGVYRYIKDRVTDLNIIKRSNAVWCCDWCISAPKEIVGDYEACKTFFSTVYDFLSNRYGEENVASCYVHYDEGIKEENESKLFYSAHAHFCFIPVVTTNDTIFDEALGILTTTSKEKVSAKELINRQELSVIHNQLQEYLNNNLPFTANIINGATKGKNMSVKELKYKSELEKDIKDLSKQLEQIKKDITTITTNFITLNETASRYNNILIAEEQERSKEISKSSEHIQNLMGSYDYAFDDIIRQLEYRDNIVYKIDTSYDKSLTVLKELEETVKKSEELTKEIDEKSKEYKKLYDNDLEM